MHPPKLKAVRYNGDFRITFTFDDGLTSELNFHNSPFFERTGPVLEPLRDETFFAQAFMDHEILTWPNGYDVCPDVLRFWCVQGRVSSQKEIDAHFQSALSQLT